MSDIEGIDNLCERLDGLATQALMDKATHGLRLGLKKMRDTAVLKARVDTGELRENIRYDVRQYGSFVLGGVKSTAPHAGFVELGTGPKGQANHAGISPKISPTYTMRPWVYFNPKTQTFVRTSGMPASPYMYPAYLETKDIVAQEIANAIMKGDGA